VNHWTYKNDSDKHEGVEHIMNSKCKDIEYGVYQEELELFLLKDRIVKYDRIIDFRSASTQLLNRFNLPMGTNIF